MGGIRTHITPVLHRNFDVFSCKFCIQLLSVLFFEIKNLLCSPQHIESF